MAKTGIVWQRGKSPRDLAAAIERQYGVSKHVAAVGAIARYMEGVLEAHAKKHAPWKDRTGNARSGLFSVTDISRDIVTLYLSHGMEYGVFLELCNQGKYAIIMKTLQAHYPTIKKMLDDLYKN